MIENLDLFINAIKNIDKDLDAYEYNGYTYEEYENCINKNIKGNRSLRSIVKYNSGGSHIWLSWMEESIDKCKKLANNLVLYNKNKYSFDKEEINNIEKLANRLIETRKTFKKNTDDLSIYPIQSIDINNNLIIIIKYLQNVKNML